MSDPFIFPSVDESDLTATRIRGVRLRDLFAIMTVHAVISHWTPSDSQECDHLAKRAYEMADALLKARVEP